MKAVNTFHNESVKPSPQPVDLSAPYISPAPKSFIKEEKWYIQERGKVVEMTPTRRKNYQRWFGPARHTLGALDMGLVQHEQLDKIPNQLQRTVQRLTTSPIIIVERSSEQSEFVHHRSNGSNKMIVTNNSESVHPRSNIFHRMKTSNASELVTKEASVFDRLEAFSVQTFKDPLNTKVRKMTTSLVSSETIKVPVLGKWLEPKLQWRPKRM